jgi:hypothetical protein
MIYRNSELRLDQMITYLNDDKINLSPVFQRGHVWKVETRRKLIRNIVQGRPIPAVFIYKEPSGNRYSYNVLDGKQRIESLILFIGNQRTGTERDQIIIQDWVKYFHLAKDRKDVNFWISLPDVGKKTFKQLSDDVVRDFGEYSIPTIEITMTDETSLTEIIDLFVDINQEGEPVKRFDVVKAIGRENPLLQSVFDAIAVEETRSRDVFYKMKNNDFTFVIKRLGLIAKIPDSNAKVDRMWERMLEVLSFLRTGRHRNPVEILNTFIKTRGNQSKSDKPDSKISVAENRELRRVFGFLKKAYKAGVSNTPLATDQTHFYTMITTIIADDLLGKFSEASLTKKLIAFGGFLSNPPKRGKPFFRQMSTFLEVSRKQTTHFSRRDERQKLFKEVIEGL